MQELLEIICQQSGFAKRQIQTRVDKYISIIRLIPITYKYHYQSPELINFYRNFLLADYGSFHKLVLLKLMSSFKIEKSALKLPQSMQLSYDSEFCRIQQLIKENDFKFDWQNDLFAKDMGICSGRLLPVGPGILGVSGIPRILLFKKDIMQFLRLAFLMIFRLRGRKPVLANHLHLANISEFTMEGWEKYYSIIAEILELNPKVKGLMRFAWFIDPAVSKISPGLAYLREVPIQNGADIFYHNNEGRDSGSFVRSKKRLALFEKGEYTPRIYYLVWPRDGLIQYVNNRNG